MKPQLGLLPAEPGRPRLALPLIVGLATPPAEIHNIELDSDTDMLANNEYSCCAVAGLERDRRVSRAALGLPLNKQSASQVLAVYQQYVGTTAKPGPGIVLQRLLEWVRKNPAGFGGDHLLAFGDPRVSQLPIRQMVNEFHSGLFGTEIDEAQTYAYSAAHGWIWDAIPGPQEGGHCEAAGSFDSSYIYCKTWGRVAKMTPAYVAGKMGEVWATVWDFEWNSLTHERQTQIIADLSALTSDAWNGPAPVAPPEATMIAFSLDDPIGTLNVDANPLIQGKRLDTGALVSVKPGPTLVYAKIHLTDGLGPETLDAHTAYVTAEKVAILARNGTFVPVNSPLPAHPFSVTKTYDITVSGTVNADGSVTIP